MDIDEAQVGRLVQQMVDDAGATVSTALARIGHRLGLYRAMVGAGPLTPGELAERTGTHERYVREWLGNQAASGYLRHHPGLEAYELPPEHAVVLADENSPVYMAPAWEQMAAVWAMEERLREAFRSGRGIGWHEQEPVLFEATEAFFRSAYRASLVDQWIPALDGVEDVLKQGGRVADVGCGHGAATILLAEAFPAARIVGFDYHAASVEVARQRAADAGLDGDGLRFEVAAADEYPAPPDGYDLICFFDALHDFGDPVGAAVHARSALAEGGRVMLVEIRAGDRTEDNLNPLGRLGYGMSTFVCTPHSLSQKGQMALGGQAGPAKLGQVLAAAGFSQVRQVAEGPIHQVLEARP
jgi:SAM-dependent methyltransferase